MQKVKTGLSSSTADTKLIFGEYMKLEYCMDRSVCIGLLPGVSQFISFVFIIYELWHVSTYARSIN